MSTNKRYSLRMRLFVVIFLPLVGLSILLGIWRYQVAQKTSKELFDRALLSTALAISRDISRSGGDALSLSTRNLIQDASGGEVFYHATGPSGIYITGYAYPPVVPNGGHNIELSPRYYDSIYYHEPVRVLQISEHISIDGLSGISTLTVWQRKVGRNAFARRLAFGTAALIGVLLFALSLLIWFGVALGLRPLTELEEAIALRSSDDLNRIQRSVPNEVRGVVHTLNRLFEELRASLASHQEFISNAAHQLRNPAAAILLMAEAMQASTSEDDRNRRLKQLLKAARSSSRMIEQLLSLEHLSSRNSQAKKKNIELNGFLEEFCLELGASVLVQNIEFTYQPSKEAITVMAEPFYLGEAIRNLIDNALKHGGKGLSHICLEVSKTDSHAQISVIDDGVGLHSESHETIFERFVQIEPSDGSGLGLAIVQSIAEFHGGLVRLAPSSSGACFVLSLPLAAKGNDCTHT